VSAVCLVHLVWAPLGAEPVRRFVRSYTEHPPGLGHRLLVVLNGFDDGEVPREVTAALDAVEHETLRPQQPVQDLAAYRLAAERAAWAERMCFVNSHSEPLADGWLAKLDAQLSRPRVGIVGATGSHESQFSSAARPFRPWRSRFYPPFPNPHVRTNGFMLRRSDMLALEWSIGRSKSSAHRLESGKAGITRQLLARGLQPLVVDRDGRGHAPEAWAVSRTYRSGEQEGLLIADNRTRHYAAAPPRERAWLASLAWGPAADGRDRR